MRFYRGSLAATLLLSCICLLAGLLLLGCSEEKVKPPITSSGIGQDVPKQESWDATITFTDSGRITALLRAGHISVFAEQRITLLDSTIRVDFFDRMGRHSSTLTARYGRVNDATHDFEASSNVVVVSDSGTTLKTEVLYWNSREQKVHTPAYVEIISPSEHIRGHGFESDQSLRHYVIFKPTGQTTPDE